MSISGGGGGGGGKYTELSKNFIGKCDLQLYPAAGISWSWVWKTDDSWAFSQSFIEKQHSKVNPWN